MAELLQQVNETATFLRKHNFSGAGIGIVLGTGLSEFIAHVRVANEMSYHDIPHFPVSTVEFHKGKLISGFIGDKQVLIMQGRFHYYEGYSMQQITFPIRVMHALGVKHLLLSNAAGGINLSYKKGDLVLLHDHINLQPENPLRGLNDPAFGNRFVDMSCPYDSKLNAALLRAAAYTGTPLHQGVYAAVIGPNLETRAEYRYIKTIGADVVGMSTVPEVIVANHMGLACAAISVVTDECDPDNLQPVNIEEIIAVAHAADAKLSAIWEQAIGAI